MPKQDTTNHTPMRHFRLSDLTMEALDEIANRYHVDRTTALKIAVHGFIEYEGGGPKKKSKKSALPR